MNDVKKALMDKILKGNHEVPIICVPIVERGKADIISTIKECMNNNTEAVEWRVDFFEEYNSLAEIKDVLEAVKDYTENMLFIYTVRTKPQGGEIELDETNLMKLYNVAVESETVDFIDMECFSMKLANDEVQRIQKSGKKVIISHHEFNETPNEQVLKNIFEELNNTKADVVKIAVMPQNSNDVVKLLKFTCDIKDEYPDRPVITISMGKLGVVSRLMGEVFGSVLTFATMEKQSAPGQLTQNQVKEILEVIHKA
ncbi:type I 3-dehydroquinate dehydratase [Lachnobacterium bovis]|uniref:type I 3-dehydroquinate dehydratase n=1 Tax=Lachnobacterium bovis TaxID=140626 RepID=UPI00068B321C|nr:type I 3-dehydroquinate dehydratase [Lachnobacterium bovis]